jgi:DNA gyrase/topoisomerase IV subunit A
MNKSQVNALIELLENYIECWKQLHHYIALARAKKSEPDDEAQFLEVKSILAQQLEMILATVSTKFPTREEVHKLLSDLPSIRYLSEAGEDVLRSTESRWHRIYIGWQAILGQMKVKQRETKPQSGWWFSRALARRAV